MYRKFTRKQIRHHIRSRLLYDDDVDSDYKNERLRNDLESQAIELGIDAFESYMKLIVMLKEAES